MDNQIDTLQKKQKIEHGKHPHLIIAKHNTLVPWPTLIVLFSELLKFKNYFFQNQNIMKNKYEYLRNIFTC